MIAINAYKTSDGILHESYQDAKSHAEKRYGDQLTRMAHELVRIDKYSDMIDKLDGYKGSMNLLIELSSDLIVESK